MKTKALAFWIWLIMVAMFANYAAAQNQTPIYNLSKTNVIRGTNWVASVSHPGQTNGTRATTWAIVFSNFLNGAIGGYGTNSGFVWITNGAVSVVSNGLTGQALTFSNGVPQWIEFPSTGGAATNAVSTIKTNGVNVSTAATSLDWIDANGITWSATASGGAVTVTPSISLIYSNAVYVNATGTVFQSGANLTNLVRRAVAGQTVVVGPGEYNFTNMFPLNTRGVNFHMLPGAILRAHAHAGNAAGVFADLGVATTNWIVSHGQIYATNQVGFFQTHASTKYYLDLTDVFIDPTAPDSLAVFGHEDGELVAIVRGTARSKYYDLWYNAFPGKLLLWVNKAEAGDSLIEANAGYTNIADCVININHATALTTTGETDNFIGLNSNIVANVGTILMLRTNATIGTMVSNIAPTAILRGHYIKAHPNAIVPVISYKSGIGGGTSFTLDGYTIDGPNGIDPILVAATGSKFTMRNVTIHPGASATNWIRSDLAGGATVTIDGNVAVGPYLAKHSSITVVGSTNVAKGIVTDYISSESGVFHGDGLGNTLRYTNESNGAFSTFTDNGLFGLTSGGSSWQVGNWNGPILAFSTTGLSVDPSGTPRASLGSATSEYNAVYATNMFASKTNTFQHARFTGPATNSIPYIGGGGIVSTVALSGLTLSGGTLTAAAASGITNLFSQTLSNATVKPLVVGSGTAAGATNTTGQIRGIEAGANVTLTENGSNVVIAATGGAATTNFNVASFNHADVSNSVRLVSAETNGWAVFDGSRYLKNAARVVYVETNQPLRAIIQAQTAGTVVVLGAGTNNVTDRIDVPHGVSIRGLGARVSYIQSSDSSDMIITPGSDSVFEDFGIVVTDRSTIMSPFGTAPGMKGATNVSISRVFFDSETDFLYIDQSVPIRNWAIRDCWGNSKWDTLAVASNGFHEILISDCNFMVNQSGATHASITAGSSDVTALRWFGGGAITIQNCRWTFTNLVAAATNTTPYLILDERADAGMLTMKGCTITMDTGFKFARFKGLGSNKQYTIEDLTINGRETGPSLNSGVPVNGSYTNTLNDTVVLMQSASARTNRLIDASIRGGGAFSGSTVTIVDDTATASGTNIIIATSVGQTIDGASEARISTDRGSKTFMIRGTNWVTVASPAYIGAPTNSIPWVGANGIISTVSFSGLTLSGGLLTASAASTNFAVTTHNYLTAGGVVVTNYLDRVATNITANTANIDPDGPGFVRLAPTGTATYSWTSTRTEGSPPRDLLVELITSQSVTFPSGIHWGTQGGPFIATANTNWFTLRWDGTNWHGRSHQVLTTGSGPYVLQTNSTVYSQTNNAMVIADVATNSIPYIGGGGVVSTSAFNGLRLNNGMLSVEGFARSHISNHLANVRPFEIAVPRNSATAPVVFGMSSTLAQWTSNNMVAPTSTRSAHLLCSSGITTNSDFGFAADSGAAFDGATNYYWALQIALTNLVDLRFQIGWQASRTLDNPAEAAIVRFCPATSGDTTWKALTSTASTYQTNDTGITVVAETLYVIGQLRTNGVVVTYINGVPLATNTTTTTSHGFGFPSLTGRCVATNVAPDQVTKGVRFWGGSGWVAY